MRREICLWVEWSWAQGLLRADAPQDEIESWSRSLAHSLARAHPTRFGSLDESAAHIAILIRRSLNALSYGQRQPTDMHPERLSYLHRTFASLAA